MTICHSECGAVPIRWADALFPVASVASGAPCPASYPGTLARNPPCAPQGAPFLRKTEEDFTPYEVVSLIRGVLGDRVALYFDELMVILCNVFHVVHPSDKFAMFVRDCIAYGEEKGLFVRSVSDRISLA